MEHQQNAFQEQFECHTKEPTVSELHDYYLTYLENELQMQHTPTPGHYTVYALNDVQWNNAHFDVKGSEKVVIVVEEGNYVLYLDVMGKREKIDMHGEYEDAYIAAIRNLVKSCMYRYFLKYDRDVTPLVVKFGKMNSNKRVTTLLRDDEEDMEDISAYIY